MSVRGRFHVRLKQWAGISYMHAHKDINAKGQRTGKQVVWKSRITRKPEWEA